jgi:hypothetical protein
LSWFSLVANTNRANLHKRQQTGQMEQTMTSQQTTNPAQPITPQQQQGGASAPQQQQQGSVPVIRDWASI